MCFSYLLKMTRLKNEIRSKSITDQENDLLIRIKKLISLLKHFSPCNRTLSNSIICEVTVSWCVC